MQKYCTYLSHHLSRSSQDTHVKCMMVTSIHHTCDEPHPTWACLVLPISCLLTTYHHMHSLFHKQGQVKEVFPEEELLTSDGS